MTVELPHNFLVNINALAKYVSGHPASGVTRKLENLYSIKFKGFGAFLERSSTGVRLISKCETVVININSEHIHDIIRMPQIKRKSPLSKTPKQNDKGEIINQSF